MSSTKVSTGQIADSAISTAKIADDAVTSDKIIDGAITAAKIATGVIPVFSAVRQTVQVGPTIAGGLPDFLPATSASLSITSNSFVTEPLVVSASQGFGNAAERVGICSTTLTWSGLTASTTNYLFVDVAADGVLTTGSTVTAPVYSQYATSGTNTFSISTMTMYSTGTTKAWRVFVGEAVTGVGTVTSTTEYAYNGFFTADYAISGVTVQQVVTHNIGAGCNINVAAVCIDAGGEWGWSQNDVINIPANHDYQTGNGIHYGVNADKKTAVILNNLTYGVHVFSKTAYGNNTLTITKWNWRAVVRRAF